MARRPSGEGRPGPAADYSCRMTTTLDPADPVAEPEAGAGSAGPAAGATTADDLVEDDLLVEEISIDGMCGVY